MTHRGKEGRILTVFLIILGIASIFILARTEDSGGLARLTDLTERNASSHN